MKLVPTFGIGLLFLSGMAVMNTPDSAHAVPVRESPPGRATGPVDWKATRIAFEMRGKPWRSVVDWFAAQSGMPYRTKYPVPPGTFTFINPKDKSGKAREYDLTEIYDIINEIMIGATKHVLVRGATTLAVFPEDAYDFPSPLRVPLNELTQYGKTEFVEVVVWMSPRDGMAARNGFADPNRITPLGDDLYLVRGNVGSLLRYLDTTER